MLEILIVSCKEIFVNNICHENESLKIFVNTFLSLIL